jgi:hypothetical protein
VAAVTGLTLCSLLKVIAEGSVLFSFSLLPALGVNIFGYDFTNHNQGALSLLKADMLVQLSAGLPYHLPKFTAACSNYAKNMQNGSEIEISSTR